MADENNVQGPDDSEPTSEQQDQSAHPAPPAEERWGAPIDKERCRELRHRLDAWNAPGADHGSKRGPFDGERLTGAEVYCLAEHVRTVYGDPTEWAVVPDLHLEKAILSGAYLDGANLSKAHLDETNLVDAHMSKVDLRDTCLEKATLSFAHVENADLRGANLHRAKVRRAHLNGAKLQDSQLTEADLEGADLSSTGLSGARLEGAVLYGANLQAANFGPAYAAPEGRHGLGPSGAIPQNVRLEDADISEAVFTRTLPPGADLEEWERKDFDSASPLNPYLDPAILSHADLRIAHLEKATLFQAQMDGAELWGAHLEGVNLREAHLQHAHLSTAHLEGADLRAAHLEGADLRAAHLEGADLREAHLEGADLGKALVLVPRDLIPALFKGLDLELAKLYCLIFIPTHLQGADLQLAILDGADLRDARLEGADLRGARFERANLSSAHLEGRAMDEDDLTRIRKWKPRFPAIVPPADMRLAFMDAATLLNHIVLSDDKRRSVKLADVHRGDANHAVVDWAPFTHKKAVLGDEQAALNWKPDPATQSADEQKQTCLTLFRAAVRANRQLATAMRDQGMNEEADHFAYRAQVLQRKLYRREGHWFRWAFWFFVLEALAGYGYRLRRIFIAYALIVGLFAVAYFVPDFVPDVVSGKVTLTVPHALDALLRALDALQLSLNAIHGRVFFTQVHLDTVQLWLATVESIVGILVEGIFVAMLIQRFFGR